MSSNEQGNRSLTVSRYRPRLVAVSILVAVLGASVAVFFLVEGEQKPLTEMPRARFERLEIDEALAAIRARAAAFSLRDDEQRLVDEMRLMHRAEVASALGKERKDRSLALFDNFRKTAASMASADRGRFIALGEKLAVELQDAVDALLEVGKRDGIERVITSSSKELDRAVSTGGLFIFKSVERGLVSENGELLGPRFLPEVLFRKRWCGAVGLSGAEGFLAAETRAALDFTAAFTQRLDERLKAIDALAEADKSYDAKAARAIVRSAAEQNPNP